MIDWFGVYAYHILCCQYLLLHCFCLFFFQLIWSYVPPFCPLWVGCLCFLVCSDILISLFIFFCFFSLHSLPLPYPFVDASMSSILSLRPSPSSLVISHNWYCGVKGFILCFCFPTCQGKLRLTTSQPITPCYWNLYLLTLRWWSVHCCMKGLWQWVWPPSQNIMSSWLWNKLTGFLRSSVVVTYNINILMCVFIIGRKKRQKKAICLKIFPMRNRQFDISFLVCFLNAGICLWLWANLVGLLKNLSTGKE